MCRGALLVSPRATALLEAAERGPCRQVASAAPLLPEARAQAFIRLCRVQPFPVRCRLAKRGTSRPVSAKVSVHAIFPLLIQLQGVKSVVAGLICRQRGGHRPLWATRAPRQPRQASATPVCGLRCPRRDRRWRGETSLRSPLGGRLAPVAARVSAGRASGASCKAALALLDWNLPSRRNARRSE